MKRWQLDRKYRIPLIYFLFSVLWILFTDEIAFTASPNLQDFAFYSTLKGILFVILSTSLIYFLVRADEIRKKQLVGEIVAVQRSFNMLFEDNPQPMWIYDNHSLSILAVNPTACRVYGYTPEEFRALKITDLRRKDEIPSLLKTLAEYKDDLRQSGPWEHVKKDGEGIIVKVVSHPLRTAGLESTLVSVIDLTEHQKALSDLDVAMQERDDFEAFGYTASHDLKAPLRAVVGYSDILLKEFKNKLDFEALGFLEQIRKAGMNMNEMLDDMLILSGISRKPLQYQKVDISAVFTEAFKTLTDLDPDRKVAAKITANMTAIADEGVVRLIAQNLLQNAWKYTRKQKKPRIEVGELINETGEKVFFVKDNGIGFEQTFADRVFEPFKRAHKSLVYEGLGIGLSIVRRAVEHHGGRVWAKAELEKGACFFFTLQQQIETAHTKS